MPQLEDAVIHGRSGITIQLRTVDGMRIATYTFPNSWGRLHVIETESGRDSAADEIFRYMQQPLGDGAISEAATWQHVTRFRRHPLACHAMKGVLLSQQFTCNYGVAYKHAVKIETTPLHEAPRGVQLGMALIRKRVAEAGIELSKEMNEIYPVKYVESQRMNFHDDGEPGLGPVVASLSLGVAATMKFRLKARFTHKNAAAADAADGDSRMLAHDRTVISLPLRHGSVCIQDGHNVQSHYDHAVEPRNTSGSSGAGGLRYALTARAIYEEIKSKPSKPGRAAPRGSTAPRAPAAPRASAAKRAKKPPRHEDPDVGDIAIDSILNAVDPGRNGCIPGQLPADTADEETVADAL
jgi:alkylated DNA repair dioxygenase AlkB